MSDQNDHPSTEGEAGGGHDELVLVEEPAPASLKSGEPGIAPVHPDRVRLLVISGYLLFILVCILGFVGLLAFGMQEEAKDLAQLVFTPILTSAAPIFAFYFGTRRS